MQHIPHHNLDEIERGRREMEAFRKERNVARAEEDEMVITAVKCPSCGAMISDLRGHPCLR